MEPKFDVEGPNFTSIKGKRKHDHIFTSTDSSNVPMKSPWVTLEPYSKLWKSILSHIKSV